MKRANWVLQSGVLLIALLVPWSMQSQARGVVPDATGGGHEVTQGAADAGPVEGLTVADLSVTPGDPGAVLPPVAQRPLAAVTSTVDFPFGWNLISLAVDDQVGCPGLILLGRIDLGVEADAGGYLVDKMQFPALSVSIPVGFVLRIVAGGEGGKTLVSRLVVRYIHGKVWCVLADSPAL